MVYGFGHPIAKLSSLPLTAPGPRFDFLIAKPSPQRFLQVGLLIVDLEKKAERVRATA